jgi:hypothetical protein
MTVSFLICITFIGFSRLIALVRNSSNIFNKSWEREHMHLLCRNSWLIFCTVYFYYYFYVALFLHLSTSYNIKLYIWKQMTRLARNQFWANHMHD